MVRPGKMAGPAEVAKNLQQEKLIMKAADKIGIDLIKEPYLRWIAEYATSPEVPDDWAEFEDDHGELAYFNHNTKVLKRTHPVLDKFEDFVEQQRKFMTRRGAPSDQDSLFLSDNSLAEKIGVIINEVMNRYHKELPPVTPELVERMALYFGIPTEDEYFLSKQLRFAMEGFVNHQYDVIQVTKTAVDPKVFLMNMRREIIKKCVLEKEDPLVMCSEYPERSAKMKIQELKDFFSEEAYKDLNLKRKKYTILQVVQDVCNACDNQRATLVSIENGFKICDEEYAKRKNDFIGHRMKRIKGLPCGHCNDTFSQDINEPQESEYDNPADAHRFKLTKTGPKKCVAEYYCEDCVELYCGECFIETHRKGKRLQHLYMHINEDGQLVRSGEVLPPEEGQALIDKAVKASSGGVWLPFRDDQFNTYWYHLRDKIITHANPYL